MRKKLLNTKVTVKLRKSEYKEEWYLTVEAYPVNDQSDMLLCDSTYNFSMRLLPEMSDSQRHTFFQPYNGTLLPEVYSHGLEHVVLHYEDGCVHSFSSFWNTVQEGRYSYCASPDGNKVKFVVADYLAVEVCINMAV